MERKKSIFNLIDDAEARGMGQQVRAFANKVYGDYVDKLSPKSLEALKISQGVVKGVNKVNLVKFDKQLFDEEFVNTYYSTLPDGTMFIPVVSDPFEMARNACYLNNSDRQRQFAYFAEYVGVK
jgi:hypothetical protein